MAALLAGRRLQQRLQLGVVRFWCTPLGRRSLALLSTSAPNRLPPVSSPKGLIDRRPHLDVEHILGDLTPPPHFRDASFDTYVPGDPTQEAALTTLRSFASRVDAPRPTRRGLFRRSSAPAGRYGVYLDGGFGVGKTHLLASLWKSVEGPKTYGTFVEYTNLVGLLGFRRAVEVLKNNRLVCIDEFELDDLLPVQFSNLVRPAGGGASTLRLGPRPGRDRGRRINYCCTISGRVFR